MVMQLGSVPLAHLGSTLGFSQNPSEMEIPVSNDLAKWSMEVDDAPILRYIYRNFNPTRHLEFGTWQGLGVTLCLEECNATVWTVNLLRGLVKSNGESAYGISLDQRDSIQEWARISGIEVEDWPATDKIGYIGRLYLEKNYGHRVCQIYCDSTEWDVSNYSYDFFDSVLIDGGHDPHVVINDTKKALEMLRSGGIIIWHDYCPPVAGKFESVKGVSEAINNMQDYLNEHLMQCFWINPSWILVGVKK